MKRVRIFYPRVVLYLLKAIPFAARDPMRVIPSTMVGGGAIAGDHPCIFGCNTDGATRWPCPSGDPACGRTCDATFALADCPGTIVCGLMYVLLKPSAVAQTVHSSPCSWSGVSGQLFYFHCHQNRQQSSIAITVINLSYFAWSATQNNDLPKPCRRDIMKAYHCRNCCRRDLIDERFRSLRCSKSDRCRKTFPAPVYAKWRIPTRKKPVTKSLPGMGSSGGVNKSPRIPLISALPMRRRSTKN